MIEPPASLQDVTPRLTTGVFVRANSLSSVPGQQALQHMSCHFVISFCTLTCLRKKHRKHPSRTCCCISPHVQESRFELSSSLHNFHWCCALPAAANLQHRACGSELQNCFLPVVVCPGLRLLSCVYSHAFERSACLQLCQRLPVINVLLKSFIS